MQQLYAIMQQAIGTIRLKITISSLPNFKWFQFYPKSLLTHGHLYGVADINILLYKLGQNQIDSKYNKIKTMYNFKQTKQYLKFQQLKRTAEAQFAMRGSFYLKPCLFDPKIKGIAWLQPPWFWYQTNKPSKRVVSLVPIG